MNKVKLSTVLFAGLGLACTAVGESAEPVAYDGLWTGLQYEMRLSTGTDYNRLVNSGANGREVVQVPSNYTGSAAAPAQPSFENVSFTRYGLAAETERAIIFPASSYVNDTEGKVYYFKNGAKLLDRSIQSEELTIHLRLRQDGLAANKKVTYFVPVFQNGWSESGDKGCGFKIGFQCGDTSAESMMPMLHFGKKYITHGGGKQDGQERPWVVLEKGTWYDWIFRLKADGQGATHYRFSLYGKNGLVKTFDGYASNDCLRATCTNPTMTLGTDLPSACATDWSKADVANNYVSIFKGAVSHCRVWNRELTDDEVKALIFVADGRKWSIGVRDGKADEFATGTEEQRTFDVQTMDWWQFPKALTKASPSVTISDVFKQTGITATGYAQWLDVQPLTNALPANAKVEVRANGRYVGTYDLAQESQRCIPLPCGKMGTDMNGRIAVTLMRVGDLGEPLVFDAVSLTAGCKISDATVAADGFGYTSNKRFSLDETNRTRCRAVLVNKADESGVNYYQEFAFDMPAAVAGKADVRYDLTFGTKNPSAGDPVKVFLNGEEVTEIPAGQSDWGIVQVLLPCAKILPGYNVIRIEIVSSTTGHYQYLHAHALSFVVPESEGATTGVSEGLAYDLAFDGTATFNRLCNAGASGRQTTTVNTSVGTVPEHIPALPVVATRDITLRYDTLTNQPCVVFPANVYTNDSSAIRCCRKGLKLTDSTLSGAMTVHLRFRYDGRPINQTTYFIPMFQNGWSKTKKTGFWMGLSDQSPESGAYSSVYTTLRFGEKYHIFGYGASGDGKSLPLTIVDPKRWYDWIVRVWPNGDGTTSYDTHLVCAATDPIVFTHDAVAHDALRTVPDTTNPTMTLGCVGTNAGDSDWRNSSIGGEGDDEGGIFNGSIAKCRVWNRRITDDEINAVLKQQDGTKWSLGVKDGTSDEFAAGDAADVARTYEPATMDWRRFPKGLTAAEPAVTIRDSFVGSHVNYVRNFHYLTIEPVLTSLPANAKLLVTVNSREIATVDLADESQRTVLLPASAMRKDGNGKTSVTIRRVGADLSGTLSFDALSLVGGGQVGEAFESGLPDGYGNNYHNRQFAFGDMSSSHCTETTGSSVWGADNDKLDFSVQVPQRLVGIGALRYETRIKPQYGQLGQEPFKVLFNGTVVQDYPTGCANGTKIVLDLPTNLVRPGLNTVRLLNCVTLEDLPAGSTLKQAYISYDYHKLQFVAEDVKTGFLLLVK